MTTSYFTISLDFELFWGVYDIASIDSYGDNILGGRKAIPEILSLFSNYNIHATWAIVGMASFENKKELMNYLPDIRPNYRNIKKDPYRHLEHVGENEEEDPYHFGYSLLSQIMDVEGMEIGSHSFSHYYCLEEDDREAFNADLDSANRTFRRLGINTSSIIFCRNQYNDSWLQVAKEKGFLCFRGNENHYFHKSRKKYGLLLRACRLADSYLNIGGNYLSVAKEDRSGLVNIPSSFFLRPYNRNNLIEVRKLRRIKSSMLEAAKQGKGFHLWWHPHNFGKNLQENILSLKNILNYFRTLQINYGMESLSMSEASIKYFKSEI
jgi:peptidoglycan/xylan/chitin deacetylase (PgdA/CDA1 family)